MTLLPALLAVALAAPAGATLLPLRDWQERPISYDPARATVLYLMHMDVVAGGDPDRRIRDAMELAVSSRLSKLMRVDVPQDSQGRRQWADLGPEEDPRMYFLERSGERPNLVLVFQVRSSGRQGTAPYADMARVRRVLESVPASGSWRESPLLLGAPIREWGLSVSLRPGELCPGLQDVHAIVLRPGVDLRSVAEGCAPGRGETPWITAKNMRVEIGQRLRELRDERSARR